MPVRRPPEVAVDDPSPPTVGALSITPCRRPGSVRRTITVDVDRPDGPFGDVVVTATGQDLVTLADGSSFVAASQHASLRADFVTDQRVKAVDAAPPRAGLDTLVGVPSRRGFRNAVHERTAGDPTRPTLLDTMLYDVPIVTSLSRMALRRRGVVSIRPGEPDYLGNRGEPATAAAWAGAPIECAGWAPGSTMNRRQAAGLTPNADEPPSPAIVRDDDPAGWHQLPTLPPDGFRRWRRTDLWSTGEEFVADTWWRDTYVDVHGELRVIHEYSVDVHIDPMSLIISEVEAIPRVLPGPECSPAADSADRLTGASIVGLGSVVRRDFSGYSTCTHLNDHLHGLGDLASLLKLYKVQPPSGAA